MTKTIDPKLARQIREESDQTKDAPLPNRATYTAEPKPVTDLLGTAEPGRTRDGPKGRRRQTPPRIDPGSVLDPRTTRSRAISLTLVVGTHDQAAESASSRRERTDAKRAAGPAYAVNILNRGHPLVHRRALRPSAKRQHQTRPRPRVHHRAPW